MHMQWREGRGASARLVHCYASRERKAQRVRLEPAVAHYFGWLAVACVRKHSRCSPHHETDRLTSYLLFSFLNLTFTQILLLIHGN
jgi:hypothetical protein